MIRFLLKRPIAVFMCFSCLAIFGIIALKRIPISLLPDIDIPEVLVKISYPGTSAEVIEENITKTVRDNLVTLNQLSDIQTMSSAHSATLRLDFNYGIRMNLAFIEVNEKLDLLSNVLPRNMPRPQVVRLNTSDVPILRVQIVPVNRGDFVDVSELTDKVLKKRLEQIPGISLVDLNGVQKSIITLAPNKERLSAAGLKEDDLTEAIRSTNSEVGSLAVNDGQYRYFIKFNSHLQSVEEIASIPIRLANGVVTTVDKFAKIQLEENEALGYHLFNGKRSLVLTIHKQASAKMNNIMPLLHAAIHDFRKDYPQIHFSETQDQSFLLEQAIQNLTQDLWYGGFFCVFLLFLFIGNYASPLLMGISIPLSLLLTFIFFYLFKISFNMISLSGLALGIGMLIDNSIVVLDSITHERKNGKNIDDSCVKGVRAVLSPVISNVLTTVAIYLPLIYLNGLAGALVYDQAVTLTISLSVSLLVAFVLNPVMYKFFLRTDPALLKDDTRIYKWLAAGYHNMIRRIFKKKRKYLLITVLMMPIGFIPFCFLKLQALPVITEAETMAKIDWKTPVSAHENKRRIELMTVLLKKHVVHWEAEIGISQFLFDNDENHVETSTIYYKCHNEHAKRDIDKYLVNWINKNYPEAVVSLHAAPNAFTQLFETKEPYFEARFRPFKNESTMSRQPDISKVIKRYIGSHFSQGPGLDQEQSIVIKPNIRQMELYGINRAYLASELQLLFGSDPVSEIRRFGESQGIYFRYPHHGIGVDLSKLIRSTNGSSYPLKTFISYSTEMEQKVVTADKGGAYQSISFEKGASNNFSNLQNKLRKTAEKSGYRVSFHGQYFSDQQILKDLVIIFLISLLMVYSILAIQFENLIHPIIVMLTIPLGVSGGMICLWASGGTLDIMSAIGFIVVLGIIVDDPSLKIETINRLRVAYSEAGRGNKTEVLNQALHDAGNICFKPLLMVSLTTSLSLVPVLFSGGIGNELQRPMAFVIIGGLTTGTFFTTWFIPLAYWYVTKKHS